jgi:hypothetical protein
MSVDEMSVYKMTFFPMNASHLFNWLSNGNCEFFKFWTFFSEKLPKGFCEFNYEFFS